MFVLGGTLLIAVGAALVTGACEQFIGWTRDAFVTDHITPI